MAMENALHEDLALLCRSWNRDLWLAWRAGEITFGEAAFLARRVEFHVAIDWLPDFVIDWVLAVYDMLLSPASRVSGDDGASA